MLNFFFICLDHFSFSIVVACWFLGVWLVGIVPNEIRIFDELTDFRGLKWHIVHFVNVSYSMGQMMIWIVPLSPKCQILIISMVGLDLGPLFYMSILCYTNSEKGSRRLIYWKISLLKTLTFPLSSKHQNYLRSIYALSL